ncbi:MAG: MFS transporter, partial [Pseudomonadota bacterium]|nr:MFS transporter [Pseudomonadota bacterium]
MHTDPRETLNQAGMSRLQYIVVALTVALNALDGFDVMAISFASPGIYAEWGISPAGLGLVLSMELWGMALGSLLLGGLADQFGRKPTILACLFMMTFGMYLVTTTPSLTVLSVWRFVTGLGIGGMLAAINAQAAEFSNLKNRPMAIAMMATGYPIGGILGGAVVSQLLQYYDWRSVFYFGTVVTAVMIPLVWLMMPESVHWLVRKRPTNYLARINATMTKIGHQALALIPDFPEEAQRKTFVDIFSKTMLKTTLCVTAAYFLHIVTFYFILKWVPQLVVQMGFSPAAAGGVLTWASVGGAIGAVTFGFLSNRIGLKGLTIFMFVCSAIGTILFGQTTPSLTVLSILVALAGYFINAGIVGMYAILAQVFPTHVRASGTGFTIGVGRGGSGLSPILAGVLLQSGMELPAISVVMAMGSLLAAGALLFLKLD